MRRLRLSAAGFLGVLLVVMLAAGLVAAREIPGGPAGLVEAAVHRLHGSGPVGVAGFAAAQVLIAFSGILPASLIGIAAGAVYGVLPGFALAAGSTMAGAWLAFRASRSIFRPRIERWLGGRPRLRALDAGLASESWRLVCLLRVSPVMPFAVTSYMLGLSSVSRRDYLLGTLAALPALLGYVLLGGLARAGLQAGFSGAGPLRWALLGAGLVATVVLTLRIGRILMRAGLAGGEKPEPGADLLGGPLRTGGSSLRL